MTNVDLSHVEIVDAHTHPYRLGDLLAKGSAGFDTRMMFLGESFHSSSRVHDDLWGVADGFTDSTVFALAMRRWLAAHLGCEPTREAVTSAREEALQADAVAYTKGLLDAAGVVAILSDEGFPQPPIPADEFASTIGVTVHRVTRLEPWILQHRDGSFDDLVSGVETEATDAAADPNCVAYKSIVAYRTGLDVGDPSASEAAAAFDRWRSDDWKETREHAKPVRDFLIRRTLDVAKAQRSAVPFPLRRGRSGHQPRARRSDRDLPAPRRRAGPARRPRALRLSVDPRGRLRRVGAPQRVPRALRADPLGMGAGGMGARDARRDRSRRQAPVRLRRGR